MAENRSENRAEIGKIIMACWGPEYRRLEREEEGAEGSSRNLRREIGRLVDTVRGFVPRRFGLKRGGAE